MVDASRVLIVDDDTDCRILIATLLTLDGYEVLTAADASEGLAQALRYRPSLILLNLLMRVCDGFEFRAAQQRNSAIADTPVVLLSSRFDADESARRIGAQGVLRKPIALTALRKTVAAWVPLGETHKEAHAC